jgi:anti-anti-sigma factor
VAEKRSSAPLATAYAGAPGGTVVEVTAEVRGDEVRVGLAGQIDASNAARLREALAGLDVDHARVRIDVTALTFVDCAGLAVLCTLGRARPGGRPRLEGIRHPSVRRIVELTGAAAEPIDTVASPRATSS